jgi:hypothetical protein
MRNGDSMCCGCDGVTSHDVTCDVMDVTATQFLTVPEGLSGLGTKLRFR